MGRLLIICFHFCFLISCLTATHIPAGNPCDGIDEDYIERHIPVGEFEIISRKPAGDICEIIINADNSRIPLYAGMGYVIAGDMFVEKKRVTQETMDALRKELLSRNMSRFDQLAAFAYVPARPSGRVLYMVTEPLCPYCHRAAEKIIPIAESLGLTVKAVMYSVHGDRGFEKCVEVICSDISLKEYVSIKWDDVETPKAVQCGEGIKKARDSSKLAEEMGIDGVPFIFLDDGTEIQNSRLDRLGEYLD